MYEYYASFNFYFKNYIIVHIIINKYNLYCKYINNFSMYILCHIVLV